MAWNSQAPFMKEMFYRIETYLTVNEPRLCLFTCSRVNVEHVQDIGEVKAHMPFLDPRCNEAADCREIACQSHRSNDTHQLFGCRISQDLKRQPCQGMQVCNAANGSHGQGDRKSNGKNITVDGTPA